MTITPAQPNMHIVNYNDILSHYIKIFVFELCARSYISNIMPLYPVYHEQLVLHEVYYIYSHQITMVTFAGSTILWLFADDESASFITTMGGCIKLARLLYLLYSGGGGGSMFIFFDIGYSIIELVLYMYFIWAVSSFLTNHLFICMNMHATILLNENKYNTPI